MKVSDKAEWETIAAAVIYWWIQNDKYDTTNSILHIFGIHSKRFFLTTYTSKCINYYSSEWILWNSVYEWKLCFGIDYYRLAKCLENIYTHTFILQFFLKYYIKLSFRNVFRSSLRIKKTIENILGGGESRLLYLVLCAIHYDKNIKILRRWHKLNSNPYFQISVS